MAVLRKRGKNYTLDYRVQGRRVRKAIGKSKRIAELALKDVEVKLARQETSLQVKEISIEKFLIEYSKYSKSTHSPATIRRYNAVIDHFKSFLEDDKVASKLSQLNVKVFDDYKIYRKQEYIAKNTGSLKTAKTNTINMELKTLRTLLYKAVDWGYLTTNPLKNIKLLRVIDAKSPRFLSKEEIDKLLQSSSELLRPIFFTFLNTGMRLNELINLEWTDVDLKRRIIKIQSKVDWHPKTYSREIPLSDKMMSLLKELKISNKFESTYVFHDSEGNKLKRDLREDLIKVANKSGITELTKIHSLRHTFASQLVMSGVDLRTVQQLLGHTSIETTMRYSHLAPSHVSNAISKLDFIKLPN